MDQSTHLKLPLLAAAQALKHLTHNEALVRLDALVHLAVLTRTPTDAPAAPEAGDRHIVANGAIGDFAGHDLDVACFQDGGWVFFTPRAGWLAWVVAEDALVVWDGSAWVATGSGGAASVNPAPLVGVNAMADATNRLSVNAPASLFNHEGPTTG